MTSGTCGDCKHWEHPRSDFATCVRAVYGYGESDEEFDRREADAENADRAYGRCLGVPQGPEELDDAPLPLAMVKDGSEYFAALFTLPDFGCALFAARDSEGDS